MKALSRTTVRRNGRPARTVDARARPVAAVARACALLDAFRTGPTVLLGLTELSERTGLYKSTVLRLAGTLEQHGLLQKSTDGRYQVGPATFQLAKRYESVMTPGTVLLPVLTWLVRETGESAGFHVSVNGRRMCLYQVDSPHPLRSHFKPGDLSPLDRGAGGQVLTEFAAGLPSRMNGRMVVRAVSELSEGMTGIACPVFDASGRLLGAMSISGPSARFTKKAVPGFEQKLLEAARRATLALGGDGSAYPVGATRKSPTGRKTTNRKRRAQES